MSSVEVKTEKWSGNQSLKLDGIRVETTGTVSFLLTLIPSPMVGKLSSEKLKCKNFPGVVCPLYPGANH